MKKIFIIIGLLCIPLTSLAQSLDTDGDNLTDEDEVYIWHTNPMDQDTDNDGYNDGHEIANHFSPHQPGLSLSQTDFDNDGLSDWLEMQFKTDMATSDTDQDGYDDYTEIINSYDPKNPQPVKLSQKIVISTTDQTLTAYLDNIPLVTFPVSTGKPGWETPVGTYKINNKVDRAWSQTYGLWMPYWMSFIGSQYGIHELPVWPGGLKEGENHLGHPISHGCVRLGIGPAKWLYDWSEIGTTVIVE